VRTVPGAISVLPQPPATRRQRSPPSYSLPPGERTRGGVDGFTITDASDKLQHGKRDVAGHGLAVDKCRSATGYGAGADLGSKTGQKAPTAAEPISWFPA